MPDVFRTDNPLLYTQLEGVIVTEKSPPPTVVGAGNNNCVFLGQFERGPENRATLISSIAELQNLFGSNMAYKGNKALRLKKWSNLYVIRVLAAAATAATWTQTGNKITITALWKGKYGNALKVTIAAGSSGNADEKRFTFQLGDITETFDNVDTAGKSDEELQVIFGSSALVKVTGASATQTPDDVASKEIGDGVGGSTAGTDGVVAASDYTTALENADIRASGKLYFADDQSAGVAAAIATFVKLNAAGQCILGPPSLDTSVDDAITAFNAVKDNKGRVLFAYNPILHNIGDGLGVVSEEESPVFLAASILNLLPPHKSPSSASSVDYTQNATGVKYSLSRANLIKLKEAGIMAFEDDKDLGIKLVSGVTGDPEWTVLRRRMSDFYIDSVARYLKNYQDEPNSLILRASIKAAIQEFDDILVGNGILPADNEVEGGRAFLCETEGITSDTEKAQGILKVVIKRRLFPAARFIVLVATISESVVVEEA